MTERKLPTKAGETWWCVYFGADGASHLCLAVVYEIENFELWTRLILARRSETFATLPVLFDRITWIARIPGPAELAAMEAVVEAAEPAMRLIEDTPWRYGIPDSVAKLRTALAALDAARKDSK